MSANNGDGAIDITPAAELRQMREQGVPQTLLSGTKVRIRTVTPDKLLKSGHVPDILTPLVTKMLYEEVSNAELNAFIDPKENLADSLAMIDSINAVCEAALVYPRIVEDPQADDEISIDDLSIADRGWIFKLAFQPAYVLRRFRLDQSVGNVEDSTDSEGDVQPSE